MLFIALTTLTARAADDLDQFFPQSDIVIEAREWACYRFNVYVARNNAQWRRGLMHVRELDSWHGMLFVYRDSGRRSMWMKNTFIPLDILFIRGDGSIASIAEHTEPLSLRSIASTEAVRFVLELNAGTSARLGIAPGDRLIWSGEIREPAVSEY